MPKNKEKRSVLVARFSALGDIAMTLPAVYDACTANPDTAFYFLTRHHPAQLFINKQANLTIVPINFDNYKGMGGMWRLAKALRKRYGITHFVDLHDVLRTKFLRLFLRLSGVTCHHIEKGRRARNELTRRNNKVLIQLKPMPERYRDVFYKSGVALANDFDGLWPKGKAPAEEFAKVTPPKKEGEYWLAIAPFAKHRGKVYPINQLERVVENFAHREGYKIFIFGFGEEESGIIEKMARRFPAVVNMAKANIGLAAELALLNHCDTMLSMDSANMHLASLVGLRAVSVWGATHPYAGFLGWRQRTRDVIQLDVTCRPCSIFGDRPCYRSDYHCLAGINPRIIIDRIDNP